jgi:hypothetical protein
MVKKEEPAAIVPRTENAEEPAPAETEIKEGEQ